MTLQVRRYACVTHDLIMEHAMVQGLDKEMDAAQLDITRHTQAYLQHQTWSGYVLTLLVRHTQATKQVTAALLAAVRQAGPAGSQTALARAKAERLAAQKCFQKVDCSLIHVMIILEWSAQALLQHFCAVSCQAMLDNLACLSKHGGSCDV